MAIFSHNQSLTKYIKRRNQQDALLERSYDNNRVNELAQHIKARLLRETDLEKLTQTVW